nr:hypothetical protein [Leptospira interrogans]
MSNHCKKKLSSSKIPKVIFYKPLRRILVIGKMLYYFTAPVEWYSVLTSGIKTHSKKGSGKFWNKL